VLKSRRCDDCELNPSCVYAQFFETIIEKDNQLLSWRNRLPHPYIISVEDYLLPTRELIMGITLLGPFSKQFAYLALAIKNAGYQGILTSRIPFTINKLTANGIEIYDKQAEKIDSSPELNLKVSS